MKGRYAFYIAIALWAAVAVAAIMVNVKATAPAEEPADVEEDAGRIPGDDIPARENAWADMCEQEDYENERIEAALLEKATRIDGVIVTHYCTEKRAHICGTGDGITASGAPVQAGLTCAVDPKLIPLGATVLVDYGDQDLVYLKAQDTGGWIKGKHIDVAVESHTDALQAGRKTATIYWIKED